MLTLRLPSCEKRCPHEGSLQICFWSAYVHFSVRFSMLFIPSLKSKSKGNGTVNLQKASHPSEPDYEYPNASSAQNSSRNSAAYTYTSSSSQTATSAPHSRASCAAATSDTPRNSDTLAARAAAAAAGTAAWAPGKSRIPAWTGWLS